jgi:hypothetical protein
VEADRGGANGDGGAMKESDRWDRQDGTLIVEFPLQPNDNKLIDEFIMRIEVAGYKVVARQKSEGGMRLKLRVFYAGVVYRHEFLVVVESPLPVGEEVVKSHIYARYEEMSPKVEARLIKSEEVG